MLRAGRALVSPGLGLRFKRERFVRSYDDSAFPKIRGEAAAGSRARVIGGVANSPFLMVLKIFLWPLASANGTAK